MQSYSGEISTKLNQRAVKTIEETKCNENNVMAIYNIMPRYNQFFVVEMIMRQKIPGKGVFYA